LEKSIFSVQDAPSKNDWLLKILIQDLWAAAKVCEERFLKSPAVTEREVGNRDFGGGIEEICPSDLIFRPFN
jgi:hypothetical protein